MAYIKVDTGQFPSFKSVVQAAGSNVESICNSVYQSAINLDWEIRCSAGIESMARQIQAEMQEEADCLRKMAVFFDFAAERYNEANQQNQLADTENQVVSSLKKLGKSMITKAGLTGSVIGFFDRAVGMGKKLAKQNYAGLVADGLKEINAGYKLVAKIDKKTRNMAKAAAIMDSRTKLRSWKNTLFGLDNYFDPKKTGAVSKAASVETRYYNNFQKSWESEFGSVTPVSIALTAIDRGVKNYEQLAEGNITAERAFVEMVGETAVEITTDLALAAGTAAFLGSVTGGTVAGIAAAGAATAVAPVVVPVLAVAAVVAAEKWFLNTAVTAVTGDKDTDFVEAISNTFINIGVKIGDAIPEMTSNLKEGVRKVGEKGAVAVSNVKDICTDAIEKTKAGISGLVGNVRSGAKAVSGIRNLIRYAV